MHFDPSHDDLDEEAWVYELLARGAKFYSERNYAQAIEEYRKAIEVDHSFQVAYINLGKLYLELERPKDSAEIFQELITINHNSVQGLIYLGLSYAKLGEGAKAKDLLQTARQIDEIAVDRLLRKKEFVKLSQLD